MAAKEGRNGWTKRKRERREEGEKRTARAEERGNVRGEKEERETSMAACRSKLATPLSLHLSFHQFSSPLSCSFSPLAVHSSIRSPLPLQLPCLPGFSFAIFFPSTHCLTCCRGRESTFLHSPLSSPGKMKMVLSEGSHNEPP